MRNAGTGWQMEYPLSSLTTTASRPAVATHSYGHQDQIVVQVAWAEPDGIIKYRESNADNGMTWKPAVDLSTLDGAIPQLPDEYSLILVYPGVGIGYYKRPAVNDSWSIWPLPAPGGLGNVTGAAVCPTAACQYQVAFVKDGKIWIEGFSDPDRNNFDAQPQACGGSAVDISTTGWTPGSPSIVSNGSGLFVAWEEWSGSTHRIAFKERFGSTWSSTQYFTHGSHVPTKPSLGIDYACGTLNLVWECGDHVARVARTVAGSVWGPLEDLGGGGAPSIVGIQSRELMDANRDDARRAWGRPPRGMGGTLSNHCKKEVGLRQRMDRGPGSMDGSRSIAALTRIVRFEPSKEQP